jgi:hypothetical protein
MPGTAVLALVGLLTLAWATEASVTRRPIRSSEAVYLENAFAHELCSRDDRSLKALNRALARSARPRAAQGRYSPKP